MVTTRTFVTQTALYTWFLVWTFHYIRFECCLAVDQSRSDELCNAEIPRCNNRLPWVSTTYLTKEKWQSALPGYVKIAFHCICIPVSICIPASICIPVRLQGPRMQLLRHDKGGPERLRTGCVNVSVVCQRDDYISQSLGRRENWSK
jgi:hypothetical protein